MREIIGIICHVVDGPEVDNLIIIIMVSSAKKNLIIVILIIKSRELTWIFFLECEKCEVQQ